MGPNSQCVVSSRQKPSGGRGFKFTVNWKEIWSLHAWGDVLDDYFRNYKELIYLIGVEPIELKPTWVKNWARMDNIYKYMDWCMIHQ